MRMPSRTRCCCTADSASSDGIATRCASTPRSLQDQDVVAVVDRLHGRAAQPLERRREPAVAVADRPQQSTA